LKEHFSRGNNFCISDLLQEIHSIKQGERNVTQFYTDMKILWEELEYLRPIPRCTCGGTCQCDMSRTSHNYRDLEYVICFLKGLNEVYSTVKTQVLMMEPLPNFSCAFALLIQPERQFHGIENLDNRVVINLAEKQKNCNGPDKKSNWKLQDQGNWKLQGRNDNWKGGKGRGRSYTQWKQCSYSHKLNHTIDECYSKHGYAPWYKQRNENSEREKSNDQSCNIILRSGDNQIH